MALFGHFFPLSINNIVVYCVKLIFGAVGQSNIIFAWQPFCHSWLQRDNHLQNSPESRWPKLSLSQYLFRIGTWSWSALKTALLQSAAIRARDFHVSDVWKEIYHNTLKIHSSQHEYCYFIIAHFHGLNMIMISSTITMPIWGWWVNFHWFFLFNGFSKARFLLKAKVHFVCY